MEQTKEFNRANLPLIGADIEAALAPVAEKWGISLKRGNSTFDPRFFTLKVEGALAGGPSKREATLGDNLAMFASAYGLDMSKETLGYKLVGYNSKARSQPWIVEKGGKRYKVGHDQATLWFGKPKEKGADASAR